jgi:hypothetical protein
MTLRHFHRQAVCHDTTWARLRRGRSRVVGLAVLAFAPFAAIAACSSSPPPPPETYINATLGPAFDASGHLTCGTNIKAPVLTIGANPGGSTAPKTQPDGSTQPNAGAVNVACSVSGSFVVNLTAVLSATPIALGASLTITGNVNASSGGTVSAALSTGNFGNFGASDCTVTFTYNGGKIPTSPVIAPGRVWGHLSCPTIGSTSGMMVGSPSTTEICDVEADFLFENCES